MGIGDADYEIVARIVAEDASIPGTAAVGRRLDQLERRAKGFGSILGNNLTKAFALMGGAAGIGVAVRGVVSLNSEIQTATNGMGTLFSAFTGAPIEQSMGRARATVAGLREDAKKGVGELTNYTEGFQRIFGATGGVASDDAVRQLTKNALAAGFALRGQEGMQLAPMDIAQALSSGVSRAETPIVMTALQAIGMTSEAFNKLNPAEKIETLNKAFDTFAPGVELMGKSWDAQFSTLQDNVKDLVRTVTQPLFERWSGQLQKVNGWFEKNEQLVADMATDWGGKLLDLWDHLIDKAKVYAGLVGAAAVSQAVGPSAGSAVGGIGKLFSGGSGIGAVAGAVGAAPLAAGLAIVAAGFLGVKGALEEHPELLEMFPPILAQLKKDLGGLLNAFGMLAQEGSALNYFGAFLLGLGAVIGWVTVGIAKSLTFLVRAIGMTLKNLGFAVQAAFALAKGDVGGAKAALLAGEAYQRGEGTAIARDVGLLALITGRENAGMTITGRRTEGGAGELGADGFPVNPKGDSITNLNGPITIQVKAEVNEDPARVAIGIEEVLTHLERYRKQPKRPVKPLRY